MNHENFSDLYHAIKMREVKALNDALQNIPEDKDNCYPAEVTLREMYHTKIS